MKKLTKSALVIVVSLLIYSCGSSKPISQLKEEIEKEELQKNSSKVGTTLMKIVEDASGDVALNSINSQVIVGGLDRQIIDEKKIEKPRSILSKGFVSLNDILDLKIGEDYGVIKNRIGIPYDILHLDNKGLVVTYNYKKIHSIYDENTENLIGSNPKAKLFDSSINKAYLHFDSSNNLVLLVTDEGFRSSKSVLQFGQTINSVN
jgi:hypothetical protein